jgi:hypothetical protein
MSSTPAFPAMGPGPWGWPYVSGLYGTRYQNGILTSVQGTNASNATSYSIGKVTAGVDNVTSAKFNDLTANINAERVRRGNSGFGYSLADPIDHNHINAIKNALAITSVAMGSAYNGAWSGSNSGDGRYVASYTPIYDSYGNFTGSYTTNYASPMPDPAATTWYSGAVNAPIGDIAAGTTITAAAINTIIDGITATAAACTCNCNYCTCNCNYCTCNCNYSCTCNCNYSDERLKENIEYVRTEHGINLYSWNYLWDKTTSYVGVLAQEILDTDHAAAISTDANGYFMVDYSKLPVNMIEG